MEDMLTFPSTLSLHVIKIFKSQLLQTHSTSHNAQPIVNTEPYSLYLVMAKLT